MFMRVRNRILVASGVAVILLLAGAARAAQDSTKNSNTTNSNEAVKHKSPEGLEANLPPDPVDGAAAGSSKAGSLPAAPPGTVQLDEQTKSAYQEALRAYYEYQRSGLEHRKHVFAWQLLSSRIIFFIVIVLVLAGVYFSGVQFHSSLRAARAAEARAGEKAADLALRGTESEGSAAAKEPGGRAAEYPVTQLEASLQGIRVSSPILGVIILALSFLFFYLYLKYVYPINEIF